MSARRYRRLSRKAAFGEQGVVLKYPSSSWSGVRSDDGMVLFAVRADEVIVDADGSRCLLWAPDRNGIDSPASAERLEHCMLALQHGQAEGMLAFEDGAEVDPTLVLSLRVQRHRREYWAKWGSAACQVGPSLLEQLPGWFAQRDYALAAWAQASE